MKVLSLFDGISCARVALQRAEIPVEVYYASEIDKYAMQISAKNWPNIIQLGGVTNLNNRIVGLSQKFDLLIGGSPCQDLSIAKANRKGLDGERSGLFWEYVRMLQEIKPKYFILENVASMPQKDRDIISKTLGVEPVMINASLVSAQNRKRLFWVGKYGKVGKIPKIGENGYVDVYGYKQVEIPQPEDRGILLKDILENGVSDRLKSYCIDANYWKGTNLEQYKKKARRQVIFCISSTQKNATITKNKTSPMVSAMGMGGGHTPMVTNDFNTIRKLTPIECERLQGLPDNYTEGLSNTQRYKTLGNAFNVDVVTHILKFLK